MYKRLLPLLGVIMMMIVACKKENAAIKTTQITSVQGTIKADWGDTITISGTNLPSGVTVSFNKIQARVISNTPQQLRCIVPVFRDNITASVLIKYDNDSTLFKNYITLNAPVISSFTPTEALGDTIIIKGDHFSYNGFQVAFGDVIAGAIVTSKKTMKVIIPYNIKRVQTPISITSQLQIVNSATNFVVLKPVITSVAPSGYIGDTFTLKVPHAHSATPYQLSLDNQAISYTVKDTGAITFQLPNKLYPTRSTILKLQLLQYTVTWSPALIVKDNWVMVSDTIPFTAQGSFPLNIGTELYALARKKVTNPDQAFYLWHLNQNDFSWTQVGGSIPIPVICAGTDGSKIYLYDPFDTNNFYVCDPATALYTAKTNFPGQTRFGPSMFGAGGKLYIGAGIQTGTGVLYPTDDWYAYTPSTDQWTRLADMRKGATDAVQGAQTAVINNVAYLVSGEGYTCYQYNIATNTWTTMPAMIEERSHEGVVVYNQKLYTLKGLDYPDNGDLTHDVFKFDPVTNQWAYVPFRIDPSQLEENVAFVAGGKIYMLTYDAYGLQDKLYQGLSLP